MWFQLAMCLCCLVMGSQGQVRAASLRRANDDFTGRCQYTFTVDSPVESSCPQTGDGDPEAEGVRARLTLLEALVSRLLGEQGGSEAGLEVEESGLQAAEEVSQLRQDKERLNVQLLDLQRRLEELTLEAQDLRQKPCHQPQSPHLPTAESGELQTI